MQEFQKGLNIKLEGKNLCFCSKRMDFNQVNFKNKEMILREEKEFKIKWEQIMKWHRIEQKNWVSLFKIQI